MSKILIIILLPAESIQTHYLHALFSKATTNKFSRFKSGLIKIRLSVYGLGDVARVSTSCEACSQSHVFGSVLVAEIRRSTTRKIPTDILVS